MSFVQMIDPISALRRAVALMREAQDELDRGGHAAIAAHLETALGFADAQIERAGGAASVRDR